MVYVKDAIDIKKKWRNGAQFCTFDLKLVEPQPVKRIYKLNITDRHYGDIGIDGAAGKFFNAYIGGQVIADMDGLDDTRNLPSLAPGVYYLIVTGDITDQLNVYVELPDNHSCTLLWNRL